MWWVEVLDFFNAKQIRCQTVDKKYLLNEGRAVVAFKQEYYSEMMHLLVLVKKTIHINATFNDLIAPI